MGNQPSKKTVHEQQKQSIIQKNVIEIVQQSTPQKKWLQSQKTIEDLKQLMREDFQWPQIIRPYLRKITNKQEYQRYLRAIIQQIIEYSCADEIEFSSRRNQPQQKLNNKEMNSEAQQLINQNEIKQQKTINKKKVLSQQQLRQLFNMYKTRLQESYFVISHQKGGIKQNTGQIEFQTCLKQIQSYQSSNSSHSNQSQFYSLIPSLMVSQLYQYSSIKQKYLNQVFIQLNLKAYQALQQFTVQLIEEFIIIEDQFNLSKFIVQHDVLMKSLDYLETCTKLMQQKQKVQIFNKIKQLKQNPLKHFIQMCRIFLKFKNVQSAQLIVHNLIQKGYHLSQKQLKFYFYLQVYNIFLYGINYSSNKLRQYNEKVIQENYTLCGSLIPFNECFERLQIEDILQIFLSLKTYSQIELLRKCFVAVYSLYEPHRGEYLFLKYLKKYALSNRAHFIITIQSLKGHLTGLAQQQKEDIQIQFIHRLSQQSSSSIIDYERHVIELTRLYKFTKQGYEFVKILFKVSSILNKFEISMKVSELCQFLFYNKRMSLFLKFKQKILYNFSNNNKNKHQLKQTSLQQLQLQSLIIIKRVISKYFMLGQSRQQVVFIIEDRFDEQCFEYSTKQIQSLFILTQYLHKNLFQTFVPLQQLHQLLFQHMLYFYKYDQVEIMLKQQNLTRYSIQKLVVKMLIIQNLRQMLIKNQKQISIISQDIKKQIKIVQSLLTNPKSFTNKLMEFQPQQQPTQFIQQNQFDQQQQLQQLESIKALFKLLIKLDFYSISLSQENKQNISLNLLYFLIQHYQHQIEVFDYDQLYKLILIIQNKHSAADIMFQNDNISPPKNSYQNLQLANKSQTPITNQYLKFKIDLAHLAYQKGKIKFGQHILKQVLIYEPPWISTQIIKIIQKSPQSASINHNFLNIAFQYCVKGQDLIYLLQVWKQKVNQKHKKKGQKITQLFQSTKKYMIIDDTYVKDEKQYRNLVGQMTFNDESLKSKDYELFFTLLGTQPERAFYLIYNKSLDIVKIQIILKQGMKLGIFNIINVTKMFFKLLYFTLIKLKQTFQHKNASTTKVSFIKFKNTSIEDVIHKIQSQKMFQTQEKYKSIQKQIPYILLKKMHKAIQSLQILPSQFIQNYLENPTVTDLRQNQDSQYLYMFLFDQNYRQKHLISLKDEPMGKNDIKIYRQLCKINGLNILDLIMFSLTNQLNTVESRKIGMILDDEKVQNVLQKIVTWTQKDENLIHDILGKLILKIFSSQILYNILNYLRQKQNPLIRQIVSQQHMQILQSLKQIQVNTQFHGLITEQFFLKPISYNPKQKISQKHVKILKRQLKLRNVFLISKILYFCYGMSTQVQKQVLKQFIKENQNEKQKQIFEQIKKKLQQVDA